MPAKLIVGNWKMNGDRAAGHALVSGLAARIAAGGPPCDWVVCPPFPLLAPVADALAGSGVAMGGQDCHPAASGAHTGDVAAAMLADLGCRFVIVGHSERRQDHGEGSALVRRKAEAALDAGLVPIICIGERERERDAGKTLAVLEDQLDGSLPARSGARVVVAYEPVWAIGTGRTARPADVEEVHAHLRGLLIHRDKDGGRDVRLLYGGSVKPDNARALLSTPNVDGALVGGASLKLDDFWAIGEACRHASADPA